MGDPRLQRRDGRLRSLTGNEGEWTKLLGADPDSPEAFMGNALASMAAYVASQERQNISRRTRAGPGISPTSRSSPSGRMWRMSKLADQAAGR